jgi:Tol biopolymer transport system component
MSLAWVARNGQVLGRPAGSDLWFAPALSRNDASVAIARTEATSGLSSLWLLDLTRGALVRVTPGKGRDGSPVWSPDGKRLVYLSARGGPFALYIRDVRSGGEELLLRTNESLVPFDWSNDGSLLVYGASTEKSRFDLWLIPMSGERKPFPFVATAGDEIEAQFSPTVRWIAFTSDESGRDEVYMQGVPGREGKNQATARRWQVSTAGGSQPRWARNGQELFYRSAAGVLMSVQVRDSGNGLVVNTPVPLFSMRRPSQFRGAFTYDVSSDAQRFLIIGPVEESDITSITVVTNWASELR